MRLRERFALRLADQMVRPVATYFAVSPATAAMLNTAYALPYAIAQPFLGPLGDRLGKRRCIQVCVAGLTLMLAAGAFATSFAFVLATRICAGIFAGGLIPLVLAGLGDAYAIMERQVMIGRMLFAIIAGQMLGSVVSGLANVAFGWHSSLVIAVAIGAAAALIAWTAMPATASHDDAPGSGSFGALYGRVFANPKAPWLYGSVLFEGALFYGLFPVMGELVLATTAPGSRVVSIETGARPRRLRPRRPAPCGERAPAAASLRRAPHVPDRLDRGSRVLRRAGDLPALVARRRGDVLRRCFFFYMLHNSMCTEAAASVCVAACWARRRARTWFSRRLAGVPAPASTCRSPACRRR